MLSSGKVFEGLVESGTLGQERAVKLPWTKGGRGVKNMNVQVKVNSSSEAANLRIQVELWHGPDGSGGLLHTTMISYADPGTPVSYMNGDSDSTKQIGDYTMLIIKIKDSNTPSGGRQWAQIEVFLTQKPF